MAGHAGSSRTSFDNKSSITRCPLTVVPFVLRSAVIVLGREVPRYLSTSLRVCTRKHVFSCSAGSEAMGAVP
eukprot:11979716-Ditylum_brightwellii.AAC.1